MRIVKSGNDHGCAPSDQNDYFTFWVGSHPAYTAKADYSFAVQAFGNTNGKYIFGDYNDIETDLDSTNAVTFAYTSNSSSTDWCPSVSGYGYYATITAQDADGNGVSLIGNELYAGDYLVPGSELAYKFLGWSTEKDATAPTYSSARHIASGLKMSAGDNITLYAVWQKGIEITYNGNGADGMINMDNVEQHGYAIDLATANLRVDLLAPNFTKDAYGCIGWSTDSNAWDDLADADTTNDPTIYGPNQTITIDENLIAEAGENRKLVLNAVWAPAETDNNGNPVSLQDWQGCSTLTPTVYDSTTNTLSVGKNTITALTDSRDGNIYTVAHLADGNCWMTENLRLDSKSELSSANTHNPSLPITNDYAEQTTSNKLSASSSNWCTDNYDLACYDQSKLNTDNIVLAVNTPVFSQDFTSSIHKNFDANIYSYGNYYNWYSATSGNGTYWKHSGNADGDICPAGWQLPIGSSDNVIGSFYYLNQRMGGQCIGASF